MHTTAQSTTWTILSLIEWGANYLKDRGFEDARLNVELLLSKTLCLPRINLYTNFDRPLTATELAQFKSMFQRRLEHEPIQYILGEAVFMGIPLHVSPSVLIPRPETEELVERALDWINRLDRARVEVLEVGTGSGNIPIAIERYSSNTAITSIDVSGEALRVASENIKRHACSRIVLEQMDIFGKVFPGRTFDVIIANPPYISSAEFELLQPEVKNFEPAIATTDRADGYKFIRRICEVAADKLRSGGLLLMEVAYNQGAEARRIARDAGLVDLEVVVDGSGNERMLQARRAA